MKLFQTIHFDQSDQHVYDQAAASGEWAISGAFQFSHLAEDDLNGKTKQAFSNGFLSIESFGRATFVSVTDIQDHDRDALCNKLADHFVEHYGAPSKEAALEAAQSEIEFAQSACADNPINTIFTVKRAFNDEGAIREEYRIVTPPQEPIHARVWEIVEDE